MFKKPSSGKRGGNLSQFGLLDIPDVDDADEPLELSDDDIDLEAELAAIGGDPKPHRPRKPAPGPVNTSNLDAMIALSLKDVPSDDEDVSDEDDPELLSELKELAEEDEAPAPPPRASRPAPAIPTADSSTVSVIHDRILNYTAAEKQAKENGESSRARRFGRGLKTLNDLLKQAKAGRPVKDDDIPPPVSLGKPSAPSSAPSEAIASVDLTPVSPPEPTSPEPSIEPTPAEPTPVEPSAPEPDSPPQTSISQVDPARQEGLQVILKRQQEFKAAALASKHAGEKALALEQLKIVKQFDMVVEAYKSGEEMDLSELPTPEAVAAAFRAQQKGEDQTQHSSDPGPEPAAAEEAPGLITASTVDEALRQRLAAFQQQEAKAKADGNESKARRMGRIVKQYQQAVKSHAAGKPIDPDLPTPAGYAPLPGDGDKSSSPASPQSPHTPAPARPAPSPRPLPTRNDKQIAFLVLRQKEFKEAALKAKKSGNIEQAKEYLRAAKGFDSLIEAARGGLPVDLKSIPLPPTAKAQIEHTFDVVSAEDCTPPDEVTATGPISVDDDDALTKLSQQLTLQLKLCLTNRDHYREMGNIAEMNRFENLAMRVKQDLDVVVVNKSLGKPPPKFHYESKQFSVVQCNTDLNENDLELTIVRGITYNVPNPKEVDTYVKFEFPYPQEAPVSDRTALVKDTNSPTYNAVFPLAIHRKARPCLRVFKRHGIKFEVYSRGGWFSKDTLLGTAVVKLAPLETQVEIHDAFPLMDGRRPAGGSLEVKLRVRTPLVLQQFENTTHRWLVIDN